MVDRLRTKHEEPLTLNPLRWLLAAVVLVGGIALMSLYPTIMAVCMIPGWRTFWEAWAISAGFCTLLMAVILVAVTRD